MRPPSPSLRPRTIRGSWDATNRWTGTFVDLALERIYRVHHLPQDIKQTRGVMGATAAVWGALLVNDMLYGAWDVVALRTVALVGIPLLLWNLPTPAQYDRRVTALLCWGWVTIATVFWWVQTPIPFVLVWMVLFLMGTTAWAPVPVTHLWLSHTAVTLALGSVLWMRGEPLTRLIAVAGLAGGTGIVIASTQALRARRLQAAVWRWEALVEDREHLMAAVAHELRTPLSSTLMALELAHRSLDRTDDMFERIRSRLLGLGDLVDALLRFGGLADGLPSDLEAVPIGEMGQDLAVEFDGLWSEGTVAAEGDADVLGDSALLRSALTGILSNATRYARSKIHLTVEHHEAVLVHVDDDGPGVPEAHREEIFEPLSRLPGAGTHAGIGMGLAIATRIVEAHQGSLEVTDSPLGGARFTVRLPG